LAFALPTIASWNLLEFLDDPHVDYAREKTFDSAGKSGSRDLTVQPCEVPLRWSQVSEDPWTAGVQRPCPLKSRPKGDKSKPASGTYYARTEIVSPRDVDLWMGIGAGDHARLWVNDRLVAATCDSTAPWGRESLGKASLRKGANHLVVRYDHDKSNNPGAFNFNYFWVKVAVQGRPLDLAAAAARRESVTKSAAHLRRLPPGVVGYWNNNTSRYPDAKPVTAWDISKNQNVIWRADLELDSQEDKLAVSGKAPPAILGDRVIALVEPHFVVCLDKTTGKILWERECNLLEFTAPDKLDKSRQLWKECVEARSNLWQLGRFFHERETGLMKRGKSKKEAHAEISEKYAFANEAMKKYLNSLPFGPPTWYPWVTHSYSSPVTDGRRVWVKFGTGVAACFDRDGNRLWMSQLPKSIGGLSACPSPLLVDDRFIVEVGASEDKSLKTSAYNSCTQTRLVALDATTGKELWRSDALAQNFAPVGSPGAMRVTNGREEVDVVITASGVIVRADDGKVLHQRFMLNAGYGTPTIAGNVFYYPETAHVGHGAYRSKLTACQPVMYDCDTIGLREIWSHSMAPGSMRKNMPFDNGLLYLLDFRFFGVFDTVGQKMLRSENPRTVRQGISPWYHGIIHPHVSSVVAGDFLFLGEHGTNHHPPGRQGEDFKAFCTVMQKGSDGFIVARNWLEPTWNTVPVFDGDRTYIRTDGSLVCLGYTGDEGRAYEANENARYLLPELEFEPKDEPPVEIVPLIVPIETTKGVAGSAGTTTAPLTEQQKSPQQQTARGEAPFPRYISAPLYIVGPFPSAQAEAVWRAVGERLCQDQAIVGSDGNIPGQFGGKDVPYIDFRGFNEQCVHAVKLEGQTGMSVYFNTRLRNSCERIVRVWAPHEPAELWINGKRIAEGTRIRLGLGSYVLVARSSDTEEWPAAPGIHFRVDDSSDVVAERKAWQESVRASRPILERIAKYATRPAYASKAKALLSAIDDKSPR